MTSPTDVLQAARAIRPYLTQLLPASDAEVADKRLELILQTSTQDEARSQEILSLLNAAEPTREWMRLYLEEQKPTDEILQIMRTYHPLPGKAGAIASPRYRCPVASCHQTWYRREASAEIPNCPIHGVKLVRDSKVQAS